MADNNMPDSLNFESAESTGIKGINAVIAKGIVAAVLLAVFFIVAPLSYYAAVDMENEGVAATQNALSGLNLLINDYQTEAKNYAIAIALNSDVKQYVKARNRDALHQLLQPLLNESQLDAITIADNEGVVVFRVHAPTNYGDSILYLYSVQNALKGNVTTFIERGTVVKLGVRAGVPIKDADGRVIGVVSAGYSLDKNSLVDRVKETFKTDATVFIGDTRVATTIMENGQRAIGTKLNKDIADIVLGQGQKYTGRATILNTEYITTYEPIIGSSGKPEGVLFAGLNLAVYIAERDRMLMTVAVVAVIGVFMSILIALKLGKKISGPFTQSVKLMHESEEQFRQMFNKQNAIMWLVEPSTFKIIDANEAAQNFLGYSLEKLRGFTPLDLFIIPEETIKASHDSLREHENYLLETAVRLSTGEIRQIEVRKTLIKLDTKEFYFDILTDITERKRVEERLWYLGFHDSLTDLFNRTYFEEIMHNRNQRFRGANAIIICDLDGLKMANDTFGHEYGDQMLVKTARILTGSVGEEAVIARIGGDEFAVILSNADDQTVKEYCKKIQQEIAAGNNGNTKIPLSISLGYACSPDHTLLLKDIYIEADNNMYREKLYRSQSARSAIVKTVMKLLEERDFITEGHADRLQSIISNLGNAIGLPAAKITNLRLLGQFHDIGKVGIPDNILLKPGKLTAEEMLHMQRHCEIGNRIALASDELTPLAEWILKHHEWWNGGGYPLGLAGLEIPLECRILAIADAYDAMTSDRPYRKAMSHEDAVSELKRCAGTQFDPELVSIFCNSYPECGF